MIGNIVGQYGLGIQIKAEDKASRVIRQVRGNFDRFRRSAMTNSAKVRGHIESIGDDFRRMRGQMMLGAQFVGAGVAMAAPLFLVSRAAAKSEENLAKVKSLLVTTMDPAQVEENMHKIQAAIFETGRGSIRPIHELESAMYGLLSANLNVTESMGALKPTADLAVAGLGTMDQAVKLQTTILNTYGKRWGDTLTSIEKAFKSSNILAGTIAKYKTTLPELSQAMSYTIGMANTLGVEFAELTASIAAAQTAGLQGSLAGTGLNAFYRSATKLVKENGEVIDDSNMSLEERFRLIEEGAATMKAKASSLAGIQLADEAGNLLPLPDILNEIEKRFDITAEAAQEVARKGINGSAALSRMGVSAEKAGELQALFSDEGSRVIAVLLGQGDALRDNIRLISDSNNLDKMTAARQDTLIGKYQMTKNKLQELAVTVGDQWLASQKSVLGNIDKIIDAVRKVTEDNPQLIKTIGEVAGTLSGAFVSAGIGIAIAAIGRVLVKHPMILGLLTGAFLGQKAYKMIAGDKMAEIDRYMEEQKRVLNPANYAQLEEDYKRIDPSGLGKMMGIKDALTPVDFMIRHGLRGSKHKTFMDPGPGGRKESMPWYWYLSNEFLLSTGMFKRSFDWLDRKIHGGGETGIQQMASERIAQSPAPLKSEKKIILEINHSGLTGQAGAIATAAQIVRIVKEELRQENLTSPEGRF